MHTIKHYEQLLRSGQITRRNFITGALALGLSIPVAALLAGKAQAAIPKKGGLFRQGLTGGATGDTLDPAQTLDVYMINVSMGQLRNALTEIAPDDSLIGELAESWDVAADAATWIFKLRQDVEFHNGKTLTAEDVIASINHHRGENVKSAAKGIIASIEDIKADGKDHVVFFLNGGSADFPYLMSDYHLVICPAKDGGIDWRSGIGTGGYMLDSFDPGVRTLTKRNPNYWKQGAAHFDAIETLNIADVTARTAALQTDQLDAIATVDLKTVHLLKRTAGINVIQTTGNQHVTLPMRTDTLPYNNNHLRLALKFAINRESWLNKILTGYGELANDHPIGPANQYRATNDEIPQRSYDPEKAKYHLKKAGYDKIKLKLHLGNTAFEGAIDAGVLYSEHAKAAGIDIQIVREPEDGYWSNVWLVKPWSGSYWGGRPTEDWMFSQVYASSVDWNETKWSHDGFMKLLVEARATLDSNKRREMYVDMQRIVHDYGGAVIPIFKSYVQAVTTKVGIPDAIANNWELDGEKGTERWWFV